MANEMIERVGKVAMGAPVPLAGPWREPGDAEQDRMREVVRECIAAMEEPTEAMLEGIATDTPEFYRRMWRAMIKEASK